MQNTKNFLTFASVSRKISSTNVFIKPREKTACRLFRGEKTTFETDFYPFYRGQKAYRDGLLSVCGAVCVEPQLCQATSWAVRQSYQ